MNGVCVYHMPACRMVSSGRGMFGEGVLEDFSEWFSTQPRGMYPRDYLWFDGRGFVWYYLYHEGMDVPERFEIVDFPGGLYATAVSRDGDDADYNAAMAVLDEFIRESGCFERDFDRAQLGNIISSPETARALGYEQLNHYVPIKVKRPV